MCYSWTINHRLSENVSNIPNFSSPRTVVSMYVYIATGSARKFIVVANYLKLPLLSTWQPNYLKLPMRLTTSLCTVGRGSVPERTTCPLALGDRRKLARYPRNFGGLSSILVGNWDDMRRSSSAKGYTHGNLVTNAFNSNRRRRGTLPYFARSNIARAWFAAQSMALWQQL